MLLILFREVKFFSSISGTFCLSPSVNTNQPRAHWLGGNLLFHLRHPFQLKIERTYICCIVIFIIVSIPSSRKMKGRSHNAPMLKTQLIRNMMLKKNVLYPIAAPLNYPHFPLSFSEVWIHLT